MQLLCSMKPTRGFHLPAGWIFAFYHRLKIIQLIWCHCDCVTPKHCTFSMQFYPIFKFCLNQTHFENHMKLTSIIWITHGSLLCMILSFEFHFFQNGRHRFFVPVWIYTHTYMCTHTKTHAHTHTPIHIEFQARFDFSTGFYYFITISLPLTVFPSLSLSLILAIAFGISATELKHIVIWNSYTWPPYCKQRYRSSSTFLHKFFFPFQFAKKKGRKKWQRYDNRCIIAMIQHCANLTHSFFFVYLVRLCKPISIADILESSLIRFVCCTYVLSSVLRLYAHGKWRNYYKLFAIDIYTCIRIACGYWKPLTSNQINGDWNLVERWFVIVSLDLTLMQRLQYSSFSFHIQFHLFFHTFQIALCKADLLRQRS